MLISRHFLKIPLMTSGALILLLGGVAIISRFRVSLFINAIFKSGIGAEYQSWFEHFLSGFAFPSILFISLVLVWLLLSRGRQGNSNNRILLRARTWLLAQSEQSLYIFLLSFCALAYIAVSTSWEYEQFLKNGLFQFGQLANDVAGSVIWFYIMNVIAPCSSGSGQKQPTT
jgi:hypothetical protein